MIRQSALACMPRWELLTPRLIRNHGLRSRCLRSHRSSLNLLQNPSLAIGEAMVGQIQIFRRLSAAHMGSGNVRAITSPTASFAACKPWCCSTRLIVLIDVSDVAVPTPLDLRQRGNGGLHHTYCRANLWRTLRQCPHASDKANLNALRMTLVSAAAAA